MIHGQRNGAVDQANESILDKATGVLFTYIDRSNVGAHIHGHMVAIRIDGDWKLPATSNEFAEGQMRLCPLLRFGLNSLIFQGLRPRDIPVKF